MKTHNVTVADRVISYPHNERIISRNVQTDAICAVFDDEWKSATSMLAVFANGGTVKRIAISMAGSAATVTIPWECLEKPGELHVSFVGYLSGDARIVTQKMTRPFLVAEGGEVDGGAAAEPSPDVILVRINAAALAESRANDAAGKASAAADDASAAAGSVNEAKSAAADAASKANVAASAANSAAANASGATSAANAAAIKAMQVANSVAQGSAGSSDVAVLRQQVSNLYGRLADAIDGFIYSDGAIYCPASKASASDGAITFGSSCEASGTTVTLE